MGRRFAWGCLGFLGLVLAPLASMAGESLPDAVRKAVRHHPELAAAKSQNRAARADLGQAIANFLPTLDLKAGSGSEISNNSSTRGRRGRQEEANVEQWRSEGSLTLSQTLFEGFSGKSRYDRQQHVIASSAHTVRSVADTVALAAIEAFLEVGRQREVLKLGQENLDEHNRILIQMRQREQAGRGRKADTLQAQGRYALAHSTLVATRLRLKEVEVQYLKAVGEAPPEALEPVVTIEDMIPKNLTEAEIRALAANPQLSAAQANIRATQAVKREAESGWWPKISAEVNVGRARNLDGVKGINNETMAMLVFRYNFYKGGADLARVRAETERISESIQKSLQVRLAVEEDVRKTWHALQATQERLLDLEDYVNATTLVRQAYLDQFALGERSLLDLLDSENELYNARTMLLAARHAEAFGYYRLLAAIGTLLPTLDVPMPEEARSED
jgi:adhesin transport system outer membrane protein